MRHHAFTLIELLVVVAVIAILAAIAVPNFLEAQTRSKVTRAKSDQRTIATALEAYCVDTNDYPPESSDLPTDITPSAPINPDAGKCLVRLTTPVAYLSSTEAARDPFLRDGRASAGNVHFTQHHFFYTNYRQFATARNTLDPFGRPISYRGWGLLGFGPDKADSGMLWAPVRGAANVAPVYDPSNGTVSAGDIPRFAGELPGDVLALLNPR